MEPGPLRTIYRLAAVAAASIVGGILPTSALAAPAPFRVGAAVANIDPGYPVYTGGDGTVLSRRWARAHGSTTVTVTDAAGGIATASTHWPAAVCEAPSPWRTP